MFFERLKASACTLRFRLMLWNGGAVLLMGFVTLAAVRLGVRNTLLDEMDSNLKEDLREVSLAIKELKFPASHDLYEDIDRKARGHAAHAWYLRLLDSHGDQIWGSINAPPKPQALGDLADFSPISSHGYRTVQYHDRDPLQPNRPAYTVQVGASLDFVDKDMARLDRWVVMAGALVLIVSPLCGYFLARTATAPIADIMQTADRLHPEELHERLPIRGTGDELDQLSRTINGLLDRIGRYLEQKHDFLANAAHELRTPLAAIRSSVEVALNGNRSQEDYSELLNELLDETRTLETLVNQLLLLAETDADRLKIHREHVPFTEVVERSVEMFAGVAEFRGLEMHRQLLPNVVVEGNRHHLRQVLNNLLDNAIKFTPVGGIIRVSLTVDESRERAVLDVSDTGPGIVSEDLPHLFERFYRGDKARLRESSTRGTGLGLSICQAVVHSHGGEIRLESTPGVGTTVTVELPLLASPSFSLQRDVA
jgi:heavy metal sensor kinase